jgi:hypothetical protein
MSPGIRLTADASSLISPRRAAGRTAAWIAGLPKSQGSALRGYGRCEVATSGADALGCECPPAPAFGRRLFLDFAAKGIRTRRPGHLADVALSPVIHEEPKKHQPLATPQA